MLYVEKRPHEWTREQLEAGGPLPIRAGDCAVCGALRDDTCSPECDAGALPNEAITNAAIARLIHKK